MSVFIRLAAARHGRDIGASKRTAGPERGAPHQSHVESGDREVKCSAGSGRGSLLPAGCGGASRYGPPPARRCRAARRGARPAQGADRPSRGIRLLRHGCRQRVPAPARIVRLHPQRGADRAEPSRADARPRDAVGGCVRNAAGRDPDRPGCTPAAAGTRARRDLRCGPRRRTFARGAAAVPADGAAGLRAAADRHGTRAARAGGPGARGHLGRALDADRGQLGPESLPHGRRGAATRRPDEGLDPRASRRPVGRSRPAARAASTA